MTSDPTPSAAKQTGTVRELTLRGIALGGLITLVFTAANVYLGLKVGLTFATAIPAAVISMTILSRLANPSILENTIVQTIASAAGTLSAIIFVLPGLVMIGYWQGFPYWTTMLLCLIGGSLGVMFSVPLRRALVTGSDLPYPEGVAAAEVLKVGDEAGGATPAHRRSVLALVLGAITAAGFQIVAATKFVAAEASAAFKVGAGGTMIGGSFSLALIGVGHLVGLGVGIAMIVGLVISYAVLLPIFTHGDLPGGADVAAVVSGTFSSDVRLIGAGTIAVGAVWTLIKIMRPILSGIADALRASKTRKSGAELDLTERDLPIGVVAGIVGAAMVPLALMLWLFLRDSPLENNVGLILIALALILVLGAVVASITGFMAGLIGSSNSPISGVGILAILTVTVTLLAVFGQGDADRALTMVAFAIFVTAIIFAIASISNDNLQDLKTGQIVGATPWRQQLALLFGVAFGAAIIPPILGLLQDAFGFAGAPGAGEDALAAPQANLISTLANGVLDSSLNWNRLALGAAIGVAVIIADEALTRSGSKFRLPPLAVGMGMYLPMALTLIIPIGAALGRAYDRWCERSGGDVAGRKRLGVLLATGLIVGESLWGVVFAGIVAGTGEDAPLAIAGEGFATAAKWIGVIGFAVIVLGLYRVIVRWASAVDSAAAPRGQ